MVNQNEILKNIKLIYPHLFENSIIYDSSSSDDSRVYRIKNKNSEIFIKVSHKNSLYDEYIMTKYFHDIGLSAKVLDYKSYDYDYLITEKINGENCIDTQYLNNPNRLVETLAMILKNLHQLKTNTVPRYFRTNEYINKVKINYKNNYFQKEYFAPIISFDSIEKSYEFINKNCHKLNNNTLVHGDYCLPNIILNNWDFSGFIDLGLAGQGDKHFDIFWGMWSIYYNTKDINYSKKFLKLYGSNNFDYDLLKVIACIECFI